MPLMPTHCRPRSSPGTVLGLSALLAAGAVAQSPVVPLPAGEAPRPVVVPSQDQPTLEPVRPGVPPAAAADLNQTVSPGLVREGSLINQVPARVVQGKSGRWYAIFDNSAASGRVLPPMILLESASLQPVTRAAQRVGPDARLRLSGSVTVYRNHNYLLPTAAPLVEPARAEPAIPADPATTAPAAPSAAPRPAASEPSIDQIVAELDKAAGARPEAPSVRIAQQAAEFASDPAAEQPESAAAARVMPAGFLAGRRARIVRGSDGRLFARFDNGPSGATEPAMALLPCQNTAAIEALVDSTGDLGTLTLSGHVQVFRNRNYLLPTMYVVNRPSEQVSPAQ